MDTDRARRYDRPIGRRICIVILAVLLPTALSASLSAANPPVLSPIHAVFVGSEKATHYTITLTPAVKPNYVWTFKAPPDDKTCAKVNVGATPNELIWHHADSDNCHHVTPDHNGTIAVVVTDGDWVCQATITGTEDHDGPTPGPCVSRTASAPGTTTTATTPRPSITKTPPSKPGPCQCTSLTAAIDPSSIAFYGPHVLKHLHLEFTVDWTLTCSAGKTGCHARLVLSSPEKATGFKPAGGEIKCDGPCGKKLKGSETFTVSGGQALDYKHRAGTTMKIVLHRSCQGRKLIAPQHFELVFDRYGFVDKKRSTFAAKNG